MLYHFAYRSIFSAYTKSDSKTKVTEYATRIENIRYKNKYKALDYILP